MASEFDTENMSSEAQKSFLSSVPIKRIYRDREVVTNDLPIKCFDVSESELIALGFQRTSGDSTVCIYNSKGYFQYGYSFEISGTFGLEWEDENLCICFVRSDIRMVLNKDGKCLEMKEIKNTIENNKYWNYVINATEKHTKDTTYQIRNDWGIFSFY